jgi:hypothetical protein
MEKIKGAMKSTFNAAVQPARDAFYGMWLESMPPSIKLFNNTCALAGTAILLTGTHRVDAAVGAFLIANTLNTFRMAGRDMRLKSPQP